MSAGAWAGRWWHIQLWPHLQLPVQCAYGSGNAGLCVQGCVCGCIALLMPESHSALLHADPSISAITTFLRNSCPEAAGVLGGQAAAVPAPPPIPSPQQARAAPSFSIQSLQLLTPPFQVAVAPAAPLPLTVGPPSTQPLAQSLPAAPLRRTPSTQPLAWPLPPPAPPVSRVQLLVTAMCHRAPGWEGWAALEVPGGRPGLADRPCVVRAELVACTTVLSVCASRWLLKMLRCLA